MHFFMAPSSKPCTFFFVMHDTGITETLSMILSFFFGMPFSYLFLISTFCLTSWFLYFWKAEYQPRNDYIWCFGLSFHFRLFL